MKKWLIGIVVVLLVAAGVVFACYLRGNAQLAKKRAELKAQGLPTSYAELEAKYKLPDGTPNAADIYLRAFAAYKPLSQEKQRLLPVMGSQPEPKDNESYPPEQINTAKKFIEQNQEMLNLLHEGGKVEACYYPMEPSRGFFLNPELLQDLKHTAQSLMIAEIYYTQMGQAQKAYDAAMDLFGLEHSLARSPSLICYLVRLAVTGMEISKLQDVIKIISLDAAQLLQLQERLVQNSKTISFGPGLSGEICMYLELKNIDQKISLALSAGSLSDVFTPGSLTGLIDAHQKIIEIDKLPVQEQLARIQEIVGAADDMGYYAKTLLPGIEKMYKIHLRVLAQMDCAITALAVQRYRLKEGKLPQKVDLLVPNYLPQVYVDPFDGKPLRYQLTESGYKIYCIGEDGVDDGGRTQDPNDRKATYDYAFCVYR